MKDKEKEAEIHEMASLIKQGRLLEIFETLIKNITYEIMILKKADLNVKTAEMTELLQNFDDRNELYSQSVYNQLLNDIFLPVKKLDFLRVYESFEYIMENVQRIGHRIGLSTMRDWIKDHQLQMINILIQLFDSLDDWFISIEKTQYSLDLQKISKLEKDADMLHSNFLEKLYSEENINFKEFNQAEFIGLLIEDTIDEAERLAHKIYTVILEFKESDKDLPVYLG
ncbi:MAG: hypothetical protein HeimC2_11290 [Candidatus Heimdallarchaeota archaeon LC_2]|nr:MAG: hypothetical protein HeimC2_11290 [Candidatus Heimdallarchaeota archaeon LC_2]